MATTALHPAAPAYRSRLYEWVTTTDHKKIGILYLINSFLFFFLGGLLALGVRVELAQSGLQFVTDQSYNELFTMHATFLATTVSGAAAGTPEGGGAPLPAGAPLGAGGGVAFAASILPWSHASKSAGARA